MSLLLTTIIMASPYLPSTPSLGTAEGRCRASEPGPAIIVAVEGLRDRKGSLKLEVYPSDDRDFLADDNLLIMAGKTFRRVYQRVPAQGQVQLCIRVPRAGTYSMALLHDRDGNGHFSMSSDGIGFPNNPRLGWSKPRAEAASVIAGDHLTRITVILNYRRGLLFRPLGR